MPDVQRAGDVGRRHADDERRAVWIAAGARLKVAARLPPGVDALLRRLWVIGLGNLVEASLARRLDSLFRCHRYAPSFVDAKRAFPAKDEGRLSWCHLVLRRAHCVFGQPPQPRDNGRIPCDATPDHSRRRLTGHFGGPSLRSARTTRRPVSAGWFPRTLPDQSHDTLSVYSASVHYVKRATKEAREGWRICSRWRRPHNGRAVSAASACSMRSA